MNPLQKYKPYVFALTSLFLLSIVLTFFNYSFLTTLRAVFGSFFVLFLPGFVIVKLYFKEIDLIERITLSFALSIATVPLIIFYLNKLGMKINTLNSFLTIVGIVVVAFLIKRFWKR